MTLKTDTPSFSKYGKSFQEKLAFLILDDRVFADRMVEVLDVEFLEFKHLQVFVQKIFNYKTKYGTQPSTEIMKTIVRSQIEDENETLQKQIREYFAYVLSDIKILQSAEFVKDTDDKIIYTPPKMLF